MNKYEHIEEYKIGRDLVRVGFYSHGTGYSYKIISGETGIGGSYGGTNTLAEAMEKAKTDIAYSSRFFAKKRPYADEREGEVGTMLYKLL